MLTKYNYPADRLERVLKCVLRHRSSKNAETIEELCVADADVLAHFDNIPMLFDVIFVVNGEKDCSRARELIREMLAKDFNDLSEETRKEFEGRYKTILDVVLGE